MTNISIYREIAIDDEQGKFPEGSVSIYIFSTAHFKATILCSKHTFFTSTLSIHMKFYFYYYHYHT